MEELPPRPGYASWDLRISQKGSGRGRGSHGDPEGNSYSGDLIPKESWGSQCWSMLKKLDKRVPEKLYFQGRLLVKKAIG